MNRYEVTVVNTIGHEHKIIGTWTTHAGSPRVALNKVAKRLTYPKMPPGKMMSMKFDVANQGKVIRIAEARHSEVTGGQVYTWPRKFHLADSPIPEGWAEVPKKTGRKSPWSPQT